MKLYHQLFEHLSIRDKLPRLENTYVTPFTEADLDPETELVLMSGRFRDVSQVKGVMEEYGVGQGSELLKLLPPPPPVDWRRRVKNWLARLEGSYTTDPHAWERNQKPRL